MYKAKEKGDERRPNVNHDDDNRQRAAGNKPGSESKGGQHQDKRDRLGKGKNAMFTNAIKPKPQEGKGGTGQNRMGQHNDHDDDFQGGQKGGNRSGKAGASQGGGRGKGTK